MKQFSVIVSVLLLANLTNLKAIGQNDATEIKDLFAMSFDDLLNQTIVSASKYEQSTYEAPASATIVTANDIENFGYNSLAELVNSQKGFYISNDRNYSYVGNRGFLRSADYNNRNLLLINGHTHNENFYGSAFFESTLCMNMQYIDHVEIIRGPGSSIYGTGAMLNVVNVITKKGADINGLNINATYGSFNKREISASWGAKLNNSIEISVGAIAAKTDGPDLYFKELDAPETNNGLSNGMDWEKLYGIYSTIRYRNFTLDASFTNRDKGIPTGSWGSDLYGDNKSRDRRHFIEAKYNTNEAKTLRFNLRTYIDGYTYSGSYPYREFLSFDKNQGNWAGTEAQVFLKVKGHSKITGGLEYKYNWKSLYQEWDEENSYVDIDHKFSVFSVYIQEELSLLEKVKITSGLRYDYYSDIASPVTPRLTFIYNYKPNSSFKLLYGHAFRAPNVYETLYESVDEHKANPDLKPERIIMYELVSEHQVNKKFNATISLYRYTLKNLIDQYLDAGDGLTQFRNIGKATGNGLESSLRYFSGSTGGYLSLAFQKTIDSQTDAELTNSPRFVFKSGITGQLFNFLKMSPEIFWESGRHTIYNTKTSPVFLANINLTTKKFFGKYDISLKVRNIFNREYSYPGGYEHPQTSIIQDGINFSIRLNASF